MAAAVVLVAGVAVAALLPGPIQNLAHPSVSRPAAMKTTGQPSQAPRVDSTGVKPVPSPTPTPDPRALCQEYYASFGHQETKSDSAQERAIRQTLDGLAGSSDPWKVLGFCSPYLDFESWFSKGKTANPSQGNDPRSSANQGNSGNGSGQESSDTAGQSGNTPGQTGSGTGNTSVPGASSTVTASSTSDSGSGHQSHEHLSDPAG